jgi:hypothetical protein
MPDKRLKRPRDPAQLAKLMIDIASGEVEDRKSASKTTRIRSRYSRCTIISFASIRRADHACNGC